MHSISWMKKGEGGEDNLREADEGSFKSGLENF